MHGSEGAPTTGGRWVVTFAGDIRPRGKVRLNGVVRHVLGRDYPAGHQPIYRLLHGDGIETVTKTMHVAIWDADGSVTERVESLSDWASVLTAASASNRIAWGFAEPQR